MNLQYSANLASDIESSLPYQDTKPTMRAIKWCLDL
ncbi:unnamed protein product [Brassica rapa subsp. trilocularis]